MSYKNNVENNQIETNDYFQTYSVQHNKNGIFDSTQKHSPDDSVQAYISGISPDTIPGDDPSHIKWPDKPAVPSDFNFSISYGYLEAKNRIDTYNGTFTKDLIMDGTKTVNFTIPSAEMEKIYTAFKEYRISELPEDINSNVIIGSLSVIREPEYRYSLTYTCNNETKSVVCNDGGPWDAYKGAPDTRNRLVNFVNTVCDYIYNTDIYKNMPSANGGYD